jgi:hypothetical protein
MGVPHDLTDDTLELLLELDTGPLAGVVRAVETLAVQR